MSKNDKKKKVRLAIKVHSSQPKKKKKKLSSSSSSVLPKKRTTPKLKRRFKRKKENKNQGFLEVIEKEGVIKKNRKEAKKEKSFYKYSYEEERAKIFLMRSGVVFFMLLIFVIWIYNVKQNISASYKIKNIDEKIIDLSVFQNVQDFNSGIKEIKDGMEVIKTEKNKINFKEKEDITKNEIEKTSFSSENIESLKKQIEQKIK